MTHTKNGIGTVSLFLLLNILFGAKNGIGQEKVVPLNYNPVIHKDLSETQPIARKKQKVADTLELPFFEDFSYQSHFPKNDLWADNKVFINNRMAIEPPSYGVATFDGLDESGRPYDPNRDNNNRSLPTDTLTSNFIDLSDESEDSDLYLSFFYQPKGLMDAPERVDSFLLQIKSSKDSLNPWQTIWRVSGGKDYDPVPDFKPVILPINYPDSSGFYHQGFQFRFISFGNVSGNLDNWHLDYIELGERNSADTFKRDVGIVKPPLGILKEYREVPWDHFDESYVRDEISISARNMDQSNTFAVQFGYNIVDLVNGQEVAETFSERFTKNIDPGYSMITDNQENLFDRLAFTGRDSVYLSLNAAVTMGQSGLNDDARTNDTFHKNLFFQHYFAYDDGTAEAGYGIASFFESGKVAQRFSINNRDTLRAIGFKFNQSKGDVSENSFDLKIWEDLGPLNEQHDLEQVLTKKEDLSPRYDGKGRDGFVIYELDEPIEIGGVFYIGWEQFQEYNLNVGLDKGYGRHSGREDAERKIFYNFDGMWQKSSSPQTEGAVLMIRPFLGHDSVNFFNKLNQPKNQALKKDITVKVYPNPVQDQLHFQFSGKVQSGRQKVLSIFDYSGQEMKETKVSKNKGRLNLNALPTGMYLLQVKFPESEVVLQKKLIKE